MTTPRLTLALALAGALLVPASALAQAPTFLLEWGGYGSGDGQLNTAANVAIDDAGHVYVVDAFNSRIQKFTAQGAFLAKWGSFGEGPGQFTTPVGIAIDGPVVYVTDATDRIQRFTTGGTYLGTWISNPPGLGTLEGHSHLAVDAAGNLYVSEWIGDRVRKLTSAGNYVTHWGGAGYAPGQFQGAGGIAIDGAGFVYVSDGQINQRVQKFTADGALVDVWDFPLDDVRTARFPRGVGVGPDGEIYIVDYFAAEVLKFDASGVLLVRWGSYGSAPGQFESPSNVAVDAQGNVFLADSGNFRVQKFGPAPVPVTAASWGGLKGLYRR